MPSAMFRFAVGDHRITLGEGLLECDCRDFRERARPWCRHIQSLASGGLMEREPWVEPARSPSTPVAPSDRAGGRMRGRLARWLRG